MTNEAAAIKLAERDNLVGELVGAATKFLEALEEEAQANISLEVAQKNFSNPLPEMRRAGIAIVAACTAEKKLRTVIAKAREGAQS